MRKLLALLAFCLLGSPTTALAFADCSAVPAPGVDWSRCFLEESTFIDSDLTDAKLVDTRLQRADLSRTIFNGVDARDAKFVGAELSGASFVGANLRKAD
ncbi:MAG: pentapeptide repeat-containing protein, partial [Nitratireductor sp.]